MDIRDRVIELRRITADELRANPRNWRKHPTQQAKALRKVLEQIGFAGAALAYDDPEHGLTLIDGHLRKEQVGGMPIPVLITDLTRQEADALLALHDPLAAMAETDQELLKGLIAELPALDLGDVGMDIAAVAGLTMDAPLPAEDPGAQIDKAAELQSKWQTARGDVWLIESASNPGAVHRLMCGDSTNAADVQRLMCGESAELLFTSPPYADQRDYEEGTNVDPQILKAFISVYAPYASYEVVNLGIKRKDHEFVPYWDEYIAEARSAGLKLLSWNVWDKMDAGAIGNQTAMFAISHEWIFVFGRDVKKLNRIIPNENGASAQRKALQNRTLRRGKNNEVEATSYGEMYSHKQLYTVSSHFGNRENSLHPATMTIDLPLDYIESMTDKGQIVLEPFVGSGTTHVASEQLGRLCYGMEISPEYVAIALQRLADMGLDVRREA